VTYLRYTVVSAHPNLSGVDVAVTGLPAGTNLALDTAAPAAGSGKMGDVGLLFNSSAGLSSSAFQMIEKIGSCLTGRADGDGVSLLYTLTINDWTKIRAGTTGATATFTMRDSN
jgi:hypothetical protein